jgi:predicted nucleic acid-binding protein
MQLAYREIANVINHQVKLTIPDYINSEKVEIIIIPYLYPKNEQSKKVDFNKFFGVSNIGISTIDNYLNNIRNDWDRAIFD